MAGVPPGVGQHGQVHPNMQSVQAAAAASQSQQQSVMEVDPIAKFHLLLPTLKQSLMNLIKVAGQILHQNGAVDSGIKSGDIHSQQQRFEKSLEEFYSICDQIEVNLRLALETHSQIMDSMKNTPISIAPQKPDNMPPQEGQTTSYSQYLSLVKAQVGCAKELHDMLVECMKKLEESS